MDIKEIPQLRLANQHIGLEKFKTAREIVSYLGAVQAQDYPMSKWALGIRSSGLSNSEIEADLNNGEILRTHVLRPTWHLVAREDIRWMLDLTAPSIKTILKTRHKHLGLNDRMLNGLYRLLERELADGNHLSREELILLFKNAGISLADNMAAHILLSAEIGQLICSGIIKNGKPTYALFDERVPSKNQLSRDDALEKLARIYFTSRGPATIKDFTWWSGLGMNDAKKAVQMISADFITEKKNTETYIIPNSLPILQPPGKIHFLPAYDEFLISYKDRTAMITSEEQKDIISQNGFFRPVIVLNGHVAGTWKISVAKKRKFIQAQPFKPLGKQLTAEVKKAASAIESFFFDPPQADGVPL